MTEPVTNAGRALLERLTTTDTPFAYPPDPAALIAAIEAEKEAEVRARLAEEVKKLPSMPMVAGPWENAMTVHAVLMEAVLALIQPEGAKA